MLQTTQWPWPCSDNTESVLISAVKEKKRKKKEKRQEKHFSSSKAYSIYSFKKKPQNFPLEKVNFLFRKKNRKTTTKKRHHFPWCLWSSGWFPQGKGLSVEISLMLMSWQDEPHANYQRSPWKAVGQKSRAAEPSGGVRAVNWKLWALLPPAALTGKALGW